MRFIHILAVLLMSTATTYAEVIFSDDFECGSIGESVFVKNFGDTGELYSLNLKCDPASEMESEQADTISQWFYFRMTGVKDKRIALDIEGNSSKRPFYSYDNKEFIRFGEDQVPILDSTITMRYTQDTVYIAYFPPYTRTRNLSKIEEWSKDENCRSFSIGDSEEGLAMQAIIITNDIHRGLVPNGKGRIDKRLEDKEKKLVYIQGRVHPSDVTSNWHLEAMIDTLLGNSKLARMLREETIFYIVPIANPDGVCKGYSQSNAKGIDINSNFRARSKYESQEVKNIKWFFDAYMISGLTPDLVLNMHSNSTPKVSFDVHSPESSSWEHNRNQMLMTSLTACQNPYLRYKDNEYIELEKSHIEGWISNKSMERTIGLTFKTPFSYYLEDPNGKWVTPENLADLSRYSLNAVCDYLECGTLDRITCEEPDFASQTSRQQDFRKVFFGKRYLITTANNVAIEYKTSLPRGRYTVYMWGVGENQHSVPDWQNRWIEIGSYIQEFDGKVNYKYISDKKGQAIDRIIFVQTK